jgi:Ca2+-binding RTX toxin-like protein
MPEFGVLRCPADLVTVPAPTERGAPERTKTILTEGENGLRIKGLTGALTLVILLTATTVALAAHIRGTSGGDVITGTPRADHIDGLGGDDKIVGQGGKDEIDGDDGDDSIQGDGACPEGKEKSGPYGCIPGEDDDDNIDGGNGKDAIDGNGGDDHIDGGAGADQLRGGKGDDHIQGGTGRDVIEGNSGDDRILARDGQRDEIDCGSGKDKVTADAMDDVAGNCEKVSDSSGDGDDDGHGKHGRD